MSNISIQLSDAEYDDIVPLITPQKAAALGATNIMATWTSQLIKLLTSGLVAVIITLTLIVMYQLKSTSALNHTQHVFLVDATERITAERACVAESVARQHRDVPCYLYLTSDPTPAVHKLADIYPNMYLRKWSWSPNIKDTPMEPLLGGVTWQSLNSSPSKSQELTARALSLWKHGGTTLSLDWQMVDYERCLGLGSLPYNRVDANAAAFLRLENCHVLMEKLLVQIRKEVEKGKTYEAEKIFTKALKELCPSTTGLKNEPRLCHGMQVYNGSLNCKGPLPGKKHDSIMGKCPMIRSHYLSAEDGCSDSIFPSS
ncbi:uncharacterized protein LOC124165783 [Ischnura elegans]|uniref:uncharacterized protein LOC124165783 n=1 Tax=Ischnura elegans TaxID=197161 RepID=UPI001ED86ABD|nr:uncharacterized protein LOC124165783 [Ischnura elegans]